MNTLNKLLVLVIICFTTNIFSQSLSIRNGSFRIGEDKEQSLNTIKKMGSSVSWFSDNPNDGFIKDSNGDVIGSIGFDENNKLEGILKKWDSAINHNDITTLFDVIYNVSNSVFGGYSDDLTIELKEIIEPHFQSKEIRLTKLTNNGMVKNVVSINRYGEQFDISHNIHLVK